MIFPCPIQVNNQSIYQLSDKDIVFRVIFICDVVFVLVYTFKPKKCITYVCMNTCLGSTPLTETPAFRIFCGQNIRGRNVRGRNALHSHKHDDDHSLRESHIQCDFSNECHQHTRIQMGGGGLWGTGDPDPPPGKLQNIGFP